MMLWPWIVGGLLVAAYLLLRLNHLWIGWIDRTWRNRRDRLPPEYERPRYVKRNAAGEPDLGARWPGWDGWYFLVIPTGPGAPRMIRGGLMTGLYGLEGIDNHRRLRWRLSTLHALEYLCLIPTAFGGRRVTWFTQQYLPRASDLAIDPEALHVRVGRDLRRPKAAGSPTEAGEAGSENGPAAYPRGAFKGTWPDYRLHLADPETGARLDLDYKGGKLLWWADIPGLFTYFAAFGSFEGWLRWDRAEVPGDPVPEPVRIAGHGSFEHGFAYKLFDFDPLFLPIRLVRRLLPSLRAIRYHYELFLSDDGKLHGGFMKAEGLSVTVRNHGGIYLGDDYRPLSGISIAYDPEGADRVGGHCGGGETLFYRKWQVESGSGEGKLAYAGRRDAPATHISDGMIYYDFTFKGVYAGEPVSGRGYGEYVHL